MESTKEEGTLSKFQYYSLPLLDLTKASEMEE